MIPPYYDSLIAKLIVCGRDREEAIARGRRALDFFVIEGIKTTIPLHRRILDDPDFIAGRLSTRFMERFAAQAASGSAVSCFGCLPSTPSPTAPRAASRPRRVAAAPPRGRRPRGPGAGEGRSATASCSPAAEAVAGAGRRGRGRGLRQRPRRRRARSRAIGVHLGEDDLPAAEARALLPPGAAHRRLDARRRGGPPAPSRIRPPTTSPSGPSSRARRRPVRPRARPRGARPRGRGPDEAARRDRRHHRRAARRGLGRRRRLRRR